MRALLPFVHAERLVARRSRAIVLRRAGNGPRPIRQRPGDCARHRVLIVDDEPDIRRTVPSGRSAERVACDEATERRRRPAILRTRPFDLVLLDVDMPGLSGEESAPPPPRAAAGPNLKVVMFSGQASSGRDVPHAARRGRRLPDQAVQRLQLGPG